MSQWPTTCARGWANRSAAAWSAPTRRHRRAELLDTDEPGWFDDDAPIRRVHADASMFIGGLRAILFQSLHPFAMAGVADHSDYRRDPWGRLQRTADFLAATTFGPASQAQQAVDRVHRVHRHVVGTGPDGEPYAANDPHLLEWVHLAEIDSFLAAHDRYGEQPLAAPTATGTSPTLRWSRGRSVWSTLRRPRLSLRVRLASSGRNSAARSRRGGRAYLLLQPPLPLAARAPYGIDRGAAVALMPAWTRVPLRLPWLPVSETVLFRPAGDIVTRTLRWATTP